MKDFFTMLVCLVSGAVTSAETSFQVTVLGDGVNLRTEASLESDVVAAAHYGDVLSGRSLQAEWVEVAPPKDLEVWVYGPLLFEEKEVRAPVLNVRGGPGTQFPVLGQLERGDEVTVVETSEDWHRIAVPEQVSVWISREFVQIPAGAGEPMPEPTPIPTPVPTPVPTPLPTPVPEPVTVDDVLVVEKIIEVPVVPTPRPTVTPPENLSLIPLDGQGTVSIRRGKVKAYLLAGSSPSRFMLVRVEGEGRETSLAYLLGEEDMLKSWQDQWVTVRGHDFWVSGQKLPATRVESIQADSTDSLPE
jgi:SH3-like domain-containing protein